MNAKTSGSGGEPAVPGVVPALLVLTAVTGVVDAVSFVGLGHVFTANMTGNVVFLGFALGGAGGVSALRSVVALAAFLAGGVNGGWLSARFGQAGARVLLRRAMSVEAVLLAVAAAVTAVWQMDGDAVQYSVIVLTAVAMGTRNAVVRKLAVPDLTTTVLTLTITGLASESSLAGGANRRWQRRVGAVVITLAGAVLGTLLVARSMALALGLCAVVVGVMVLLLPAKSDALLTK